MSEHSDSFNTDAYLESPYKRAWPGMVSLGASLPESSEDHATSDSSNSKPKGRAGRKLITEPPPTKRAGQNREAQRAYRERKEQYVKSLEQKVQELQDLLAQKDGNTTATASTTAISDETNTQFLQLELFEVKNENELLKKLVAATTTSSAPTSSTSPSPPVNVSDSVQPDCLNCIKLQLKSIELETQNKLLQQEIFDLKQQAVGVTFQGVPVGNESAVGALNAAEEFFRNESANVGHAFSPFDRPGSSLGMEDMMKLDPFETMFNVNPFTNFGQVVPMIGGVESLVTNPAQTAPLQQPQSIKSQSRFSSPNVVSPANPSASPANSAINSVDDWVSEEYVQGQQKQAASGISLSSFNSGKTASEMYGPFMMESTRTKLKALPSLKNSKYVDDVLQSFVTAANFTDPKMVKKHLMRVVVTKNKLLDACSLMDRQTVIEVIEAFKAMNRLHISHMYMLSSLEIKGEHVKAPIQYMQLDISEVPAIMRPFLLAVKQIPSLMDAESQDLMDGLCHLVLTQMNCTNDADREDSFFKMLDLSRRLQQNCATAEDRSKYMLATELVREGKKKFMDDWMKDAQTKV
ncbi:DNA-binding transcription factor yap1 [Chytriomyces hyalinus]|nr:DNA-binding transcription factor yap1 [Chytriomyces hyalinus]